VILARSAARHSLSPRLIEQNPKNELKAAPKETLIVPTLAVGGAHLVDQIV
jgi:hypothetical protein